MISRLIGKYTLFLTALAVLIFSGNCFGAVLGYIPNSMDNNLSVINTADSSDTDVFGPLGQSPFGVATGPAGDFIYVTNRSSNTVSQFDSQSGNILTHAVGTEPVGIAVGPEGIYVYVANQDGYLSVINTTDKSVESVKIGKSLYGVAVDPEGDFIYVTDDTDNLVYVITQSDLSVSDSLLVGESPRGVAVDQFGTYVVTANSGDNTVSVITTKDNSVGDPITVGSNPFGVAITNDANYAYITNTEDDSVSKITLSNSSVTTIELIPDTESPETPDGPQGLAVSPYGDSLYVVNNTSGTVKVITIADDTLSDTIFVVGNSPVGLGKFFFPEAPSNLIATLVNDFDIDLSWTDNAGSGTGFAIERRKYTTGIFIEIATVDADVTTYSDMNLDAYANYYYRIKAISDEGSTIYSNTDFAQTAKVEGGACFIATAAYGSYLAPHVMTLRHFRDAFLKTNNVGRSFVNAYYKYSPPIADYIAGHDGLRFVVKIGLAPLVGFSWLAINFGMTVAFAALVSLLALLIGGTCLVINKRKVS
jgi:YVTN family beta-propeller protein